MIARVRPLERMSMSNSPEPLDQATAARLSLAFAPVHKRAFGTAVGATVALVIAGLTLIHLMRPGSENSPLYLLSEFFYGYAPSLAGIFIGAAWGFFVGFVGGWFVAFSRNLILALALFVGRTREELAATRDFLDHI
jgi:hypothetical protein